MVFIKDIKVRVRRLIDLVDRSHNDLTGRDTPHAHPLSAIDGTFNNSNLLASITPIFSGWTQEPGTNADITNEENNTLSTPGISGGNSTITFDLGEIKRVNIVICGNSTESNNIAPYIQTSTDGISYQGLLGSYGAIGQNTSFPTNGCTSASVKTRYIQYVVPLGGTITHLGLRTYLV